MVPGALSGKPSKKATRAEGRSDTHLVRVPSSGVPESLRRGSALTAGPLPRGTRASSAGTARAPNPRAHSPHRSRSDALALERSVHTALTPPEGAATRAPGPSDSDSAPPLPAAAVRDWSARKSITPPQPRPPRQAQRSAGKVRDGRRFLDGGTVVVAGARGAGQRFGVSPRRCCGCRCGAHRLGPFSREKGARQQRQSKGAGRGRVPPAAGLGSCVPCLGCPRAGAAPPPR